MVISDRPRVALIAGPTASGKSALAVAIARAHDGVVINADSAQVYADLRILTARPSPEEEAQAPHVLFGHVDAADTSYSAARWASEARAAIETALGEGKLPILVGGTGLYLRTLIDGIAPIPDIDADIRATVRALPVAQAHAALALEDPHAAQRLSANDTTRVARALEVVRSTGRTLADWHAVPTGGIGDRIALGAGILLPDRDWLFDRIDARAAQMLDAGATDEVACLLARADLPPEAPIRRTIGVPEIAALLAGGADHTTTLDALRLVTRRYAKRQYTWFRNQPPAAWTRLSDSEQAQQFATMFQ
ncbi:tRNA (adenosine(37)-N6)-dimethylallyltransferase MiaA [Sphingomonas ginsenosidivorax]|uniref:tRNA dimethylallyltransferase n=1 Tax=Sphingomonas ginsenosidivorax TaxID=862135 RepID=A0A5C6UKV7_9SPHN|nr:tRNA (adenosine(37)-N6)-dimethylallyltransferase MiaA [Sphingomonas ginsenosidivorax]TXC72796.1 tRNA (adenosine(37)-N6)-dimethylallyltransferase MiaA [Sphingomonas ginsenosidivorax]